jgi:hypothetical protein
MSGGPQDTFVALHREKEDLVSTEDFNRTVLTDAIAEHLALRQRNAQLEQAMPLRDYLPNDYLRVEEPTNQGLVVPMRQWFDVDEGDALDWAA